MGGPSTKMAASPSPSAKMADSEKRRPSPAIEPTRPAVLINCASEAEDAFLLQAGVSDMVRGALLKVLEARPEEPVDFLAGYFNRLMQSSAEATVDGGDPQRQLHWRLDRALWYLRLAHHSHRIAFNNNVSMAYDSLSTGGRRKRLGVNGKLYSELLKMTLQGRGATEEMVAPLLHKITCQDHEAVPCDVFRYGVLTCLVLLEFLAKASTLYDALDGGSGTADERVCLAVLSTLEEALHASDASSPIRYLEAGSKLGPDCLALAMDKALAERKATVAMKKEEFLKKASAIFVAKVKPVG
ncbi:tubulin polyglutamylase complex subunit 1 isoform X2 [Eublepharis macularius]|uniref:Tubulin polyglutamylase complex subunit 1 isoform X2 n=1 Tax=Eublepharis macularius TaxID=481883 RepID=A0AA97JHC6_EUBMA|nr:tubulin polyglutamylase complex subunit 1 isoform X2 [Eublepharis macularius]